MRIAELFSSIQGEGTLVGVPSLFIRTSGCNLRCKWCDTPYTSWEPEGEQMSVERLTGWVRERAIRHVVITGGEPMIAPEIVELTRAISGLGRHITIETAGTVYAPVTCDLMSISPKLANSTPDAASAGIWSVRHEETRIQLDTLAKLAKGFNAQFKFVIADPEDLDEARGLVAQLGVDGGDVLLMPEGRSREEIAGRARWLVEVCKSEGWRYSPRLHIDLWGNRRGI
jgi:7-carboxy-7-deazaguanine synthase